MSSPSYAVGNRVYEFAPASWFEADARAGRLAQVSWLVAPTAQTEHPDYIAGKLSTRCRSPRLPRPGDRRLPCSVGGYVNPRPAIPAVNEPIPEQ